MIKKYERLVEIFVSATTRDKVRKAKGIMTYDEFINNILKERGF